MSFPGAPGETLLLGTVTPVECAVMTLPDGNYNIQELQDESGPEAHVEFIMRWDDRYTFVQNVLGTSTSVAGAVVRIPKLRYPPSPNLIAVAVTSIRGIKASADTGGWPGQTLAAVTVVFRRPPYSVYGDEIWDGSGRFYTVTRVKSSGEAFTPPTGAYYYESTGTQVEEASIGVLRGRVEINLTRVQIPIGIMLPIVAQCQNKLNDVAVKISGQSFDRGQLLFASADFEPSADAAGSVVEDVHINILGNTDRDFNQYQTPTGDWDYINTASDGSGDRPFGYLDWWPLLFPDV